MDEDKNKKKNKKKNNSKQVLLIIFIITIFMLFSVGMSFSALDHYENSDTNYYDKREINNIIARKKKDEDEKKPVEPPEEDEPKKPVKPKDEKKPEPVKDKTIIFEFEENVGNGNVIKLYDQVPTADSVGKNFTGENYVFKFKIRVNENALGISYRILNEKINNSTLDNKYVKMYLLKNDVEVPSVFRSNGKVKAFNEFTPVDGNSKKIILYEDIVNEADIKKGYIDFVYKMWLGDDYPKTDDMINKTFFTKIGVDAYRA